MVRSRPNDRRGFTLYETLLVLGITASLGLLLLRPGVTAQRVTNERTFWPAWQRLWTAARQTAIKTHRPVTIAIRPEQRLVVVYQYAQGQHDLERLRIPPRLTLVTSRRLLFLTAKGAANPAKLIWYSQTTQQWWHQNIGMKGVVMNVVPKKTRY